MAIIGDRIRDVRERIGLSQVELAERIGVSKQTLYKYENNIVTNIPSDKIESIASECLVSPAYIMGWEKPKEPSKGIKIPVLGRVAAGIPIEMVEDVIDWEEIDEATAKLGTIFALSIKGDSMEPRIVSGDVVIVRQQDDAESGEIVIVSVNGDDATCKRLRKYKDGIELVPSNPAYPPLYYSNEEIIEKPVRILGKVIELRGKFN